MQKWENIPIGKRLYDNTDETSITRALAASENSFITQAKGHTRFPGLAEFATLSGVAPTYLFGWQDDLIAVSDGRCYVTDKNGNSKDVTSVPISGGNRVVFSDTEGAILMAAGGPIIKYAGVKTEGLSDDAPDSTHVGYVDSYVVALENNSGRFLHSNAGVPDKWDALDIFSANAQPDNLNSLIVTDYRELILTGRSSIEQFERLANGDTPFYRRFALGEGVYAPYTMTFADNAVWAINKDWEFTRISGQTSTPGSNDIGYRLEKVNDWSGAWADKVHVKGHKFIILQIPNAENIYETKGLTYIFDYSQRIWSTLYGWDEVLGLPDRWPGWSCFRIWGRNFVGGNGRVYELKDDVYDNAGQTQRMMGRTGHISDYEVRVDNLRMKIKRGVGTPSKESFISIRCNRDNQGFGRWVRKGLGKHGKRNMTLEFGGFGSGHSFQFEWMVTDPCQVELHKLDAQMTRLGQ